MYCPAEGPLSYKTVQTAIYLLWSADNLQQLWTGGMKLIYFTSFYRRVKAQSTHSEFTESVLLKTA